MSVLLDQVKTRKSVRTFDGTGLKAEDREKLLAFIRSIDNPFHVPVTFALLDAKEHGLSSPVISGETTYVAAKVEKAPHAGEALGFSLERLVLYAWSLGIGTVWIGGTMNRAAFQKAMDLKDNEIMPCVSPLGYPAGSRSMRENMMRRAIKADDRKPAAELFFADTLGTPLSAPEDGALANALEMVRWAPSAVNKQPWRVIAKEGAYHFYRKRDKGFVSEATGDLQKIDIGIALCHFVLGLEDGGLAPLVESRDPGIAVTADMDYVASVRC